MSKRVFLFLMILAMSTFASAFNTQPGRAVAITIYVDAGNTTGPWNGSQAYPYGNVTSGLANAQSGDAIFVRNGIYHEHININKTITLIGESIENTTIDGDYQPAIPIVRIDQPNAILTNLTVKNTAPSDETFAVLIFKTQNISLINVRVQECYRAIMLIDAYYCKIINSTITRNYASGITSFENCSYGLFTGNLIMDNSAGILLQSDTCHNNTFYHNNFIRNINQVSSQAAGTKWDNGYPSSGYMWYPTYGGNYWSDHAGTDTMKGSDQNIPGADGIIDSPYVGSLGVRDNYPLKNPWGPVPPIADFTYTPTAPTKSESILFNASSSYDADGNITSYKWNFGDGNTTTTTDRTIRHSYANFGDYTVELMATDNTNLKDTTTKTVQIRTKTSTLTVTTTPSIIAIHENTTISGKLTVRSEPAPVADIAICYRLQTETMWQPLANVATNINGTYQYVWFPAALGTYEVNATYQGNDVTHPASSSTTLTVTKKSATLTINVSPTTVTIGLNITIAGKITQASPENITISISPLSNHWTEIANTTTDINGQYSYIYTTTIAGMFLFSATWQGNNETIAATDVTGFITIDRITSNITITTDTPTITAGTSMKISGKITPTRTNVSVTIQIRNSTQAVVANVTAQTDADGSYEYMWTPSKAGTYTTLARWQGDSHTNPAESNQLSITVEAKPEYPWWQYALVAAIVILVILAVIISRRKR